MRLSQMLFVTLRDDPAEAEIPSHKLLLRAGYIRRIASGVYAYLPLMWRVLQKIEQIVREEMNATGAQECLLPQLQPAELWQESGRWDTYTQAEGIMFALKDRQEREVGLGPTHEEVITAIARDLIRSYRQLPLHLYQMQTKFRDEIRPRFGLMRGREFIMKDGYSFHSDEASLKETYNDMHHAYSRIFSRCGLAFRPVDADSGAIGGSGSQEFMVLAEAGEDEILYTEDGQYAANVEKAVSLPADAVASTVKKFAKKETPDTPTIESLCTFLKCDRTQVVKNVLYNCKFDSGTIVLVLVSIRGDQEINEVKLQNELTKLAGRFNSTQVLDLRVSDEDSQRLWETQALPLGYLGPDLGDHFIKQPQEAFTKDELMHILLSHGLAEPLANQVVNELIQNDDNIFSLENVISLLDTRVKHLPQGNYGDTDNLLRVKIFVQSVKQGYPYNREGFLRLVDETAVALKNFVTGSNESGYHVVGANWGKNFPLPSQRVDVRKAQVGDRAVHNPQERLKTARGIEVGHIFQLGTKYSKTMGATYTNEQGEEVPLVMGCYGLGVSRLAQSAVEQSHDADGIVWPVAIAPFTAIICVPNISDEQQVKVAEQLYTDLNAAGIETLLDDRNERAGVKFKDADLIGIPYRIVTGRSLKEGKVELVQRQDHHSQDIAIPEVVATLKSLIAKALG